MMVPAIDLLLDFDQRCVGLRTWIKVCIEMVEMRKIPRGWKGWSDTSITVGILG
jgi:hypothetical protein